MMRNSTGGLSIRFELLGERSGRTSVVSIIYPSTEDENLAEHFRTLATPMWR